MRFVALTVVFAARDDPRLWGGVKTPEEWLAELSTVCAGLPDRRNGPLVPGAHTMADIGLSAFSLFLKAVEAPGVLAPFERLNGRTLVALDGTEHHCSRKIRCARCRQTLARPAWRLACQPVAEAIQAASSNFILTCKPASHKTVTEYRYGAELEEHHETVLKRGMRTITVYRWLSDVPPPDTEDALKVNWFSIEMLNDKGRRTYQNSFVTDPRTKSGDKPAGYS